MKTTKILLVASLFFCISCSTTTFIEDAKHVAIEYAEKPVIASSFLKSYKVIPLSSTTTESIITNTNRLLFAKNRIVVMDRIGNKLVLFDQEGNFLRSTMNMVGNGRNEYIRVLDAAIDQKNKKIYAYCDAPYCIMIFDMNLKLEKKINLDFLMSEFAVDDNYIYGIRRLNSKEIGFELIALNKKNPTQEPTVVMWSKKGVSGVYGFGKSLLSCNNNIYVSLPFDNRICRIKDAEVVSEYLIDFGKLGVTESDMKNIRNNEFLDRYSKYNWTILNMSCSDSTMVFNTNTAYTFVMNMKTNECKAYKEFISDMLPFSNSLIIPTQGLSQGVVYEVDASCVASYLRYAEKAAPSKIDSTMLKAAQQYNKNGNPVIIVWDIK